MGVPQSKHSYVYKPTKGKKLRRKTLHNSVFVEKPEYLIYDDVMLNNSTDDNSKYNTTKSCIDISAIQRRKDHMRPLSLDEDMLERPVSNISNVMHQYRQEVASQIAKTAPIVGETVSSKSQISSDGFKDVYDDDYYDNQMDSGQFQDAMSYHSLELDSIRTIEVDGTGGKLNKSAEFEFERVGSRQLSRNSSSRRIRVDKPPEKSSSSEHKAETDVSCKSDAEVSAPPKTDLAVIELPQPTPFETVRQMSTESSLEEPTTPQEIITLEEVNNILQDIKDKILHGEINDHEVYDQLHMCKKKAQGIHVTSIKIRAKKTMLIGKINKFIHWFAIPENNTLKDEKKKIENEIMMNTDESAVENETKDGSFQDVGASRTEVKAEDHCKNDVKLIQEVNIEIHGEDKCSKLDARTSFIVNTMKEQQKSPDIVDEIGSTTQKGYSTDIHSTDFITTQEIKTSVQGSTEDLQIYEVDPQLLESRTYENDPPFAEAVNSILENTSISISDDQENQQDIVEESPLTVYEQINNIRLLSQEVHDRMGAFSGRRYDLEYYNIIDQVSQAKSMLNDIKVNDAQLLEDAIFENYEKFFRDLLLYFEDLIERNENTYSEVFQDDEDDIDGHFERTRSTSESGYINAGHDFDYKSDISTNLVEWGSAHLDSLTQYEDQDRTHFVSLTEYDGKVIEACETFNKAVDFQGDEGNLSLDDDFIYNTNAAGQIVFEHEETNKPYIVDPISFSKCRMRPLSIIQEQLDEYVEFNLPVHQEHPLVQDGENADGLESEDRDDWDSFDENMYKNETVATANNGEYDEIKEFEELERNIDNIRTSMPDLVLKDKYVSEVRSNSNDSPENSGYFQEEKNDTNGQGVHQNHNSFNELLPEFDYTVNKIVPEKFTGLPSNPFVIKDVGNKNVYEHSDNIGFYSLETTSDGDPEEHSSTENIKHEHFLVEKAADTPRTEIVNQNETTVTEKQFEDPQEDEILVSPTNASSSADSDLEDIEKIFDIRNYNFHAKELESYNEIMKVNSTINNLQNRIDNFSDTKNSPEYIQTYKQIFDNMRILNNIDNCAYQEDILNLIDYLSEKLQKCIFELGLKVS